MRNKDTPPPIEAGIYGHYKDRGRDKLYAVESEDDTTLNVTNNAPEDQWLVRYRDEPQRFIGGRAVWYSREYNEFIEDVPDPDRPGEFIPRFEKLDDN